MPPLVSISLPSLQVGFPFSIVGTGKFLPSRVVTALEMDGLVGRAPGWTLRHTGVAERRFVREETTAFLAAEALRSAFASLGGGVPDLLISAGATQQQPIPCTAALIAREMGWSGMACFDVNATCLGFVAALEVAASLIAAGKYHCVAIVCAEIASKGLNWNEPEAAALMGDGAAAVICTAVERRGGVAEGDVPADPHRERGAGRDRIPGLLVSALETWPEGAALTEICGGGTALPAIEHIPGKNSEAFLFHMDGPGIFRLAAERIEAFVSKLIGSEPDRWDKIDVVIPHQGSLMAMRHLRRRLGIPAEKFVEVSSHHGNTVAASLPIALHEAICQGRWKRGETALLLGTSAGFSLGGALVRY